jgi:iron complex outermembrane recepter protein
VGLAAQQDTGKQVQQDQLGVSLDVPITARSRVLGRLYWGQRDVYSKLSVPASAQTAATSAGGIVDLDRSYGGVSLQLQHRGRLMERPIISTFGIDHDRMQEQRRGFINTAGVQGALKRNEDNSVSNLDTYAQTSWLFHDRWELNAGLRSSQVRFSVRDEFIIPGTPDDSGSKTFSALSPALGLRYSPVETVNFYAQMGRGFETPTFTELAYRSSGSGLNLALAAAQGRHFELGTKWLVSAGHRVDAAAFLVETENEIGVQSNSGGRSVFQNIGRTRREGLEVSHTGQWSETLRSRLAFTSLQAKFADPFSSGTTPVAAGNRLPGVPDTVMYGELQWNPALLARYKAGAAVEVVHVGKLWVDDANSEAAAASTLLHLRLGWVHDWGAWQLRPLIRIDNLFDRQVIGSVIVNDANRRFYEPAPGRTWLAAIQLRMKF